MDATNNNEKDVEELKFYGETVWIVLQQISSYLMKNQINIRSKMIVNYIHIQQVDKKVEGVINFSFKK